MRTPQSPQSQTREHTQFWTFRLPESLSSRVTEDATRRGESISEYIRVALMEKTTRDVR